jgi:hypothetical protein
MNSAAGSSTRARLCSFTKATTLVAAASELEKRKKFPTTTEFRLGPTLKYLKGLGVKIVSSSHQKSAEVSSMVQSIKSIFEQSEMKRAIVYTDGSTSTKIKSPNSGCGIFITDEKHTPLWSGGAVIRTDGNNFIAELAAAAIVAKAFPRNLEVLLRIDSMATIGAISKGPVSERKRIRAAGRAWLNFSRLEFLEIGHRIRVQHVRSHTGSQSVEQVGNDNADRLANKFRIQGELSKPTLYLWESEESLLFQHQNKNVQGDPRTYLKNLEKELMSKIWKEKAPKQAKWFTMHPTQVLKQSKQVWKWAVESGKGNAWLYYIVAVCQWLPTNYRMNYNNRDISSKYCNLCLGNSLDTMDHLLRCPALAKEQIRLKENVIQRFNFWAIPYASIPQKQRELVLRNQWRSLARQHFSSAVIPDLRLDLLTSGFYKANSSIQFISTIHFLQYLSQLVLKPTTSQYKLRKDFLSMLIQAFTLHTQGFTDSWNFSPLFGEWTSGNTFDIPFGCRLWSTETMHAGCNVLFFQPPDSSIKLQRLLELLTGSVI